MLETHGWEMERMAGTSIISDWPWLVWSITGKETLAMMVVGPEMSETLAFRPG